MLHLICLRLRVGFLVLSFTLFYTFRADSQDVRPIVLIPITISDGPQTVADTFGFYPGATYCIDSFLEAIHAEEEMPLGPAPPVFEGRFVEHRVGSGCLGNGLRVNLQDFFSMDTFRLKISQPNGAGFPITLRWSIDQHGAGALSELSLSEINGVVVVPDMMSDSTYEIASGTAMEFDVIGVALITAVDEPDEGVPTIISLSQNYPNPCNSTTIIKYTLPHSSPVSLKLFDQSGREVVKSFEGIKPPGVHGTRLDASNLASGIYYLTLTALESIQTRSVLVIK